VIETGREREGSDFCGRRAAEEAAASHVYVPMEEDDSCAIADISDDGMHLVLSAFLFYGSRCFSGILDPI
jgi:hypothetical protein